MNHAAWVLGHLAYVFDSMIGVLDEQPVDVAPSGRSCSTCRRSRRPIGRKYPSKAALFEAYEKAYQRIVDAVKDASADLAASFPIRAALRCRSAWPWCTSHLAPGHHLGNSRPGARRAAGRRLVLVGRSGVRIQATTSHASAVAARDIVRSARGSDTAIEVEPSSRQSITAGHRVVHRKYISCRASTRRQSRSRTPRDVIGGG